MMLSFVIKPYAIEVYSEENQKKALLGVEEITHIVDEAPADYEQRMVFVCKELATDAKKHVKGISEVEVVLSYPWCTYEHVDIKKELSPNTLVTEKLIESLRIQKVDENLSLLESNVTHILLNGYVVPGAMGQKAKDIDMQVLNVYTRTTFYTTLKKTVESIFHTHKVFISSVYTYALKGKQDNGLALTLEEESIDISYIADSKVLLNVFIPTSYVALEQNLMGILDADTKTVRDILISRAIYDEAEDAPEEKSPRVAKTMKHIWPDLQENVKTQIEKVLTDHYSIIMKYLYTLIDQVKTEHSFNNEQVRVCALTNTLAKVYGFALAKNIKNDAYIQQTMRVDSSRIFIDYLF
ncbi:MAG: hypothetical protein RJB39_346 [Candidatus Parcubacteria bacterium]|jgi:hypothetical protein